VIREPLDVLALLQLVTGEAGSRDSLLGNAEDLIGAPRDIIKNRVEPLDGPGSRDANQVVAAVGRRANHHVVCVKPMMGFVDLRAGKRRAVGSDQDRAFCRPSWILKNCVKPTLHPIPEASVGLPHGFPTLIKLVRPQFREEGLSL